MLSFTKKPQASGQAENIQAPIYTQQADPALAETIRGIRGNHAQFSTDFMGYDGEGGDGACKETRREAWLNPRSNLYHVDEITRFRLGGDDRWHFKTQPLVQTGICFFDALHMCASLQTENEKHGMHSSPFNDPQGKTVHWREAAKAAGQVPDERGVVIPCAFGRPLVAAFFDSEEALKIAQSSKDVPATVKYRPDFSALNPVAKAPGQNTAIAAALDKNREIATYNTLLMEGSAFCCHFSSPLAEHRKGALKFLANYREEKSLTNLCGKFNSVAKMLSDPQDRGLCETFMKNAAYAYWMRHALVEYDRAQGSARDARAGLPYITKATRALDLGAVDLEQLNMAYLEGKFQNEAFKHAPEKEWKNGLEEHFQYKIRLINGDATPRLHRIGEMVEGEGIYFGAYQPQDEKGLSLSRIFDLYAAPTDLVDEQGQRLEITFADASDHIASLLSWHDHDGARTIKSEEDFHRAIREEQYAELARWWIPPIDMMYRDRESPPLKMDMLFGHRFGALKEAFPSSGYDENRWGSLTPAKDQHNYKCIKTVLQSSNRPYISERCADTRMFFRPVRAVLRVPG